MSKKKWPAVVVSDLDGTLLNSEDYSFDEALPAIDRLNERGIPVVLVSSKTRREMEVLRETLGLEHPFIVENGGAAYVPEGYFEHSHDAIEWGVPYPDLIARLHEVRKETGTRFKGYADVSVEEIARLTGLGREEAERSKKREFDEPFWFQDDNEQARRYVLEQLEELGLTVARGGRFFHVMGNCDKGRAVREILNRYRSEAELCPAAGLGDAMNDLPFLLIVDRPYILSDPEGRHEPELVRAVPGATRVGSAPLGWAEAITDFLSWFDEHQVPGT